MLSRILEFLGLLVFAWTIFETMVKKVRSRMSCETKLKLPIWASVELLAWRPMENMRYSSYNIDVRNKVGQNRKNKMKLIFHHHLGNKLNGDKNEELKNGACIKSANKCFVLTMQPDNNLVLHYTITGAPMWTSNSRYIVWAIMPTP